MDRH
jgi:hypothetical protein